MKRMLVPLDESPLSEAILPVAEEWAKEDEAEVILLRAVLAHHPPFTNFTEAEVRAVEEGEAYLKEAAERLERRGLEQVRWMVWHDEPVTAIIEALVRDEAEVIAMATHGRSGLSRLLLGSVAEAVVRSAPTPVLLLRGQSAWKPWVNRKILVPLDGSETSEAILPLVERLAGPRRLVISLLRVIEPFPTAAVAEAAFKLEEIAAFNRQEAEGDLAKLAGPLRERGAWVDWAVRYGSAVDTIAAMASEVRADLIAMATHGRSGLGRLVFGSVAQGVLRRAAVPVLLFKTTQRRTA
jgi:nucleotide-binding universal stress UspA family protein